jgi:hypothetical protein
MFRFFYLDFVETLSFTGVNFDMNKFGRYLPRTIAIIILLVATAAALITWRQSQAKSALIPYSVKFHKANASDVSFVWGVNGWSSLPRQQRPERTRLIKGVMYTKMQPNDGYFETTVYVDEGDTLQFGFLTTRDAVNKAVYIWDSNQGKDYDIVVEQPQTAEFSDVPLEHSNSNRSNELVETTVRYKIPSIQQGYTVEQGYLVWGIDDWQINNDSNWSSETFINNNLMNTHMHRDGNELVATIKVPPGVKLDYFFKLQVNTNGRTVTLTDNNSNNKNYTYLVGKQAQTISLKAHPNIAKGIHTSYFKMSWQRILLGLSACLILIGISLPATLKSRGYVGDQPQKGQFKITLTFQQVKIIAIIFAMVNILFLLLSAFFAKFLSQFPGNWSALPPIKYLGIQFSLANENVVASWYSALLLLAVCLAALICFLIDQQRFIQTRSKILNYGWLLLSICFYLLSLDEISSIHERIGVLTTINPVGDWWVDILGIPILIIGFFMFLFGWVRLRKSGWTFVFFALGIFLFLSVPIQENITEALNKMPESGMIWGRPVYQLVFEEGAEIFGTLSFLIAVLLYIAAAVQPTQGIIISLKRTPLFSMILLFLGGTGFLMVLLVNTVPYFAGDFGLPDSWFPGILSLMIAVIAFISYHQPKRTSSPRALLYILLTIFCIFLSFYFGGYVPYWLEAAAENGIEFGFYFKLILAFITIVAGILLLIQMPTNLGRLLTMAGTALLVFALESPYPTVFSLPYVALSTVFIAMLYRYFYLRLSQEKEVPSSYKPPHFPSSVHR